VLIGCGGRTLAAGEDTETAPSSADGRIALPEGDANQHALSGVLDIYSLGQRAWFRYSRGTERRGDARGRSSAAAEEHLYTMSMANWATTDASQRERPRRPLRCRACNEPIEEPLALLGSLRCLACREANAPLDPTLVAEWQAEGAEF
jgi:hypothetical protein